MTSEIGFNVNQIQNLEKILDSQFSQFKLLRGLAGELKFCQVEASGIYSPISFAAFDGGRMGLNFHPFELEMIEIANSYGKSTAKFLLPMQEEITNDDLSYIDDIPEIRRFIDILGANSVGEIFTFPPNNTAIMNIAELACIINLVVEKQKQPMLIMKDGFLRTKFIKKKFKEKINYIFSDFAEQKVIGVAKRSQIINLFSTALKLEAVIPDKYVGFIEIPQEIEKLAYKWTQNTLDYPFGKLYIAKLSPNSQLLVTVEIPFDFQQNKSIYTDEDIFEIFGCLVKDSRFSFPNLGYPQTIMRAHEQAVRTGFTATIWRDKIMQELLKITTNPAMVEIMREAWYLEPSVQKEFLGGI